MNVSLWLLLACVSACSLVTTFASSARTGMPRHDTQELRRRQHLIHVLEANARLVRRAGLAPTHSDTDDPQTRTLISPPVADEGGSDAGEGGEGVGFAFAASVELAAVGEPGHGALDGPVAATQPPRSEKRPCAVAPTGRTTRTAAAAVTR